MTIIIVAEDNNEVCIGSDSAATKGDIVTYRGSKLIEHPKFTVAFAGSYEAADIIRQHGISLLDTELKQHKKWELKTQNDLYIIKDCFQHELDEHLGEHDGIFLLASPYGIFSIEENYQCHKLEKYHALGSGEEIALGALGVLHNIEYVPDLSASDIILAAIEATKTHCSSCGGDTYIKTYKKP